VETVCRNVKRWQEGDQIERWVGSGLLVAEQQFRKVIGFRHDSVVAVFHGQRSLTEADCEEGCYRIAYEFEAR
jgi:hypothetical protein